MSKALIIFIKNPVAGKVKTRLAATVGDTTAVEVYKNFFFMLIFYKEKTNGLTNSL